jgi:hypothetical protein
MRAKDGAELACRAREKVFDDGGVPVPRGVLSYYAAATLPKAITFGSWLRLIEHASQGDLASGILTPYHQPALQVLGDGRLALIGSPEMSGPPDQPESKSPGHQTGATRQG